MEHEVGDVAGVDVDGALANGVVDLPLAQHEPGEHPAHAVAAKKQVD